MRSAIDRPWLTRRPSIANLRLGTMDSGSSKPIQRDRARMLAVRFEYRHFSLDISKYIVELAPSTVGEIVFRAHKPYIAVRPS